MDKLVYVVIRLIQNDGRDEVDLLGVFDKKEDAIDYVNIAVTNEVQDLRPQFPGEEEAVDWNNELNGCATIYAGDWDTTAYRTYELTLNKRDFVSLWERW